MLVPCGRSSLRCAVEASPEARLRSMLRVVFAKQARCAKRLLLRTVEIVMAPGDDPLRIETAARLHVRHHPPAAERVGRQVADRVEEPQAVLAVDTLHRAHVL